MEQANGSSFPWDSAFNILSFILGLVLGLVQMWQSQRYFLAEQQSKFDEIRKDMRDIAQRLSVIEGVTKTLIDIDKTLAGIGRASDLLEGRVFSLVEKQMTTVSNNRLTDDASDQIKLYLNQELEKMGLSDKIDSVLRLESKVDEVFANLNNKIEVTTNRSEQISFSETQPQDSFVIEGNRFLLEEDEEIVINNDLPQARLGKNVIKLTGAEYTILKLLASQQGKRINADEIIRELALSSATSSEYVRKIIWRLQEKIGDKESVRIFSLPGGNYMITNARVE